MGRVIGIRAAGARGWDRRSTLAFSPFTQGPVGPSHRYSSSTNRFRLDLHQHRGIDETAHLDHARGRANGPEDLPVGAAHRLPVPGDVDHVDAGAHHVLEPRAARPSARPMLRRAWAAWA